MVCMCCIFVAAQPWRRHSAQVSRLADPSSRCVLCDARAPLSAAAQRRHDMTRRHPHAVVQRPCALTASLVGLSWQVAETWDSCIENTVLKLAYGTLAGGLAAIVLFRAPRLLCRCSPPPRHCARPHRPTSLLVHQVQSHTHAGSPSARTSIAGLGAGIGVGMGYTECKYEFDSIAGAEKEFKAE